VAADVPKDVVDKLSAAIKIALSMPDIHDGFEKVGTIPLYGDPQEYAENLRVNAAKFDKAIKFANIQPE
jgi:tripartite-type tricarboxylate transporter receptor subunit TctC